MNNKELLFFDVSFIAAHLQEHVVSMTTSYCQFESGQDLRNTYIADQTE